MDTPELHPPSEADPSSWFEVGPEAPLQVDPVVSPDADPAGPPGGRPRFRAANREQVVFRAAALDELIPGDHPARLVWAYVEGLDLTPLYRRIKAVEHGAGRPPIDPKVLLALWLYATIEGVGSARRLAKLCREHVAYQWLLGDLPINYHTLADFRVDHVELLDDLLTRSVAALMAEGLVDLKRVAQDGMRTRADAGAASFRRRPTLEESLAEAEAQVAALRAELEADPAAGNRRERAARQRAARERVERIQAALARLPELEAKKKAGEQDKARCSTTDAEATVMKMADGGFRPAYNLEFATDVGSQIITGMAVETSGSDVGQMVPMAQQVEDRTGTMPPEWLADGGFAQHDQIEKMSGPEIGSTVYAPVPKAKDPKVDRYAAKPSDSPAVAAWRERMGTDQAKQIYKERAATAECINAQARNRGLTRFWVRGVAKVRAVALWYVLAHNLICAARLRAAAAAQR
jgi:transposase